MRINRLVKAIAAGFMIGLAAIGTLYLPQYKAAIFPSGLLMVVLSGSELFTGRMLLIADRSLRITAILKWWAMIYAGNLIGSLFIGGMASVITTADVAYKTMMSVPELLIRSILCNILVCIAVWLSGRSDRIIDKAIVIYACISLFVLCGYEHSVANMTYLTVGVIQHSITLTGAIYNLFWVTAGNMIGGLLVGLYVRYSEK